MRRWKISVDKNVCIGSAMCVAIAPDRFALDERQRSGPVQAEIDPDEVVRDVAASCPSEAISLVDAGTGQPVDLD
jgi:ferredoxin